MSAAQAQAPPAASAPARALRQEHIEALCAATMRALSGERDLHYRARRLLHRQRPLPRWAPHLEPPLDGTHDFAVFRGAADGIACRLALSDGALHCRLVAQAVEQAQLSDPAERMLFELFEQLRVEALAPRVHALPGVEHNLARCFEAWSHAFHAAGHNASARGLLVYCIVQMVRARLTGLPAIEPDEGLLEATRASLGAALGVPLAGLKQSLGDQAGFAAHALVIARHIAQMLAGADEEDGAPRRDPAVDEDDAADDATRIAFQLWIEAPEAAFEERAALAASGKSTLLEAPGARYRVFTTAYDREAAATTLARAARLEELRRQLDARIEAARLNLAHLARDWRSLLARPAADGWQGALEEGRIDGARLARLVASPGERRLYRDERYEPRADSLVTLLIDCSGSMREHAPQVAVLADTIARTLEMAGAACEVLGFTTGACSGGRAARDWQRAGRPRHPGRLNEALHIVFKEAAMPWRRARPGLAALLEATLFREGIDGEAVQWALARQQARAADHAGERQLLIVVSDGSPMDSATREVNDRHYLDHHLRDVVARAEAQGAFVFGLGVGLDLSPYYGRSHVLDLAGGVQMANFREVIGLLGRRGWR
jgi:cobaltochelatase CobT